MPDPVQLGLAILGGAAVVLLALIWSQLDRTARRPAPPEPVALPLRMFTEPSDTTFVPGRRPPVPAPRPRP